MGAWIEIQRNRNKARVNQVAPLVGAWIEIMFKAHASVADLVAPLVGAWIEIIGERKAPKGYMSLLSWERGLKWYNRSDRGSACGRSSRGSVD